MHTFLENYLFYKTRITVDFDFTKINKCDLAVALWVRQLRKSFIIINNVSTNRRAEHIIHGRYRGSVVNSIMVTHYTVFMISCVGNNNCKPHFLSSLFAYTLIRSIRRMFCRSIHHMANAWFSAVVVHCFPSGENSVFLPSTLRLGYTASTMEYDSS